MAPTRATRRERSNKPQRPELTMNQITVETNVIESEATEVQALAMQAADALVELNASQLTLVGGGSIIIIND